MSVHDRPEARSECELSALLGARQPCGNLRVPQLSRKTDSSRFSDVKRGHFSVLSGRYTARRFHGRSHLSDTRALIHEVYPTESATSDVCAGGHLKTAGVSRLVRAPQNHELSTKLLFRQEKPTPQPAGMLGRSSELSEQSSKLGSQHQCTVNFDTKELPRAASSLKLSNAVHIIGTHGTRVLTRFPSGGFSPKRRVFPRFQSHSREECV